MTKSIYLKIALIHLGGYLICCGLPCSANETTKQRYLTEYPKEANVLKHHWEQCSGSYRVVANNKKSRQEPFNVRFSRSHGFEKFEISLVQKIDGGQIKTNSVYCAGDDKSFFSVEKPHGKQKYRVGVAKINDTERMLHETDFASCIRAPLGGFERPLITMQEEGTLKLVDANPVPGQANLIEATFAISNNTPLTQLVVRFDTGNHWSVVDQSYFVGSPPQMQASYHVDYGEKRDGIAFPVRFQVNESNSHYEFADWKFQESPRSAFSLTHYGLPDLIEAKQAKQRYGVLESYLFIGIIMTSLLGLIFFWLSRRSRKVNLS